jgi:hypothetical protein
MVISSASLGAGACAASSSTRFMQLYEECPFFTLEDQKSDPSHIFKGIDLTKSFSNAFSNADDYGRLRPNVHEIKAQYSKHLRSSANVSEAKKGRWHARGPNSA